MEKIRFDFGAAERAGHNMEEMTETFRSRILAEYQEAEDALQTAFGGEAAILFQKKMGQEEERLKNTYRTLKGAGEAMKRATRHARAVEEKAEQEIMRKSIRG